MRVSITFRLAITLLLCGAALAAQEDVPVRFDPRETGALDLDWSGYLIGTAIALAGVGAWWWLAATIERYRQMIPWRTLSYGYPTLVVTVGVGLRFTLQHIPEKVLVWILAPYVAVSLPGVFGAGIVVAIREDAPNGLLTGTAMCAMAWLFSYSAVRFLEWRAWLNVPLSLGLEPPETTGTPSH